MNDIHDNQLDKTIAMSDEHGHLRAPRLPKLETTPRSDSRHDLLSRTTADDDTGEGDVRKKKKRKKWSEKNKRDELIERSEETRQSQVDNDVTQMSTF